MGEASTFQANNRLKNELPERFGEETEPLLTVHELSRYLRLEPQTIRTLARDGKIPALKIGRIWRFRRTEILQALKQAQNGTISDSKSEGADNAGDMRR